MIEKRDEVATKRLAVWKSDVTAIALAASLTMAGSGVAWMGGSTLSRQLTNNTMRQKQEDYSAKPTTPLQPPVLSSRQGTVETKSKQNPWLTFRATWYDGRGDSLNGPDVTAVGTPLRANWTCAVDPSVIPLGSLIQVQFEDGTEHIYQALDTGEAISGRRIDIYEPDPATCLQNGVQVVHVRIVRRGYH